MILYSIHEHWTTSEGGGGVCISLIGGYTRFITDEQSKRNSYYQSYIYTVFSAVYITAAILDTGNNSEGDTVYVLDTANRTEARGRPLRRMWFLDDIQTALRFKI